MPQYKDRERNTWFCEFRYKNFDQKIKKKKKRGFKTKREAQEYERNFLANLQPNAEKILFSELSRIYLSDIKNRIKVSTYARKERIFESKLLPFFGESFISDISTLLIRNWQNAELKNNYKKSYFITVQKELNAIFNYAVKFYGLPANPLVKAGITNSSPLLREKAEINIWSAEEFNIFIENISNPEIYVIFNLLYYTGIRIGEALALNVNDIDFAEHRIAINKTYYKIKNIEYITTPKTASSIRTIKIPGFLVDILSKYTDGIYDKDARLFKTSRTNIHRCKNSIIRKLGLKNIRLHDFRHSHASILLNRGVDVVTVSKRLGHESVKMTLDTYSHLIKDSEEKLIDILNKLKK